MSNLPGIIRDSDGKDILADSLSSAMVVIDHPHRKIHDGRHWIYTNSFEIVSVGAIKWHHFRTPNTTTQQHILFGGEASGLAAICFFEAPTMPTGAGTNTARGIENQNRRSTNTTSSIIYQDPTVGAGETGTCLFTSRVGGAGVGQSKYPGSIRSEDEFILAANTSYLLKCGALVASITGSIFMNWYEV